MARGLEASEGVDPGALLRGAVRARCPRRGRGAPGLSPSVSELDAQHTYLLARRRIGCARNPGSTRRKLMTRCIRPLATAAILSSAATLALIAAPAASAALPLGYNVQKVDSPTPTNGGDFGIAMVSP